MCDIHIYMNIVYRIECVYEMIHATSTNTIYNDTKYIYIQNTYTVYIH